MAVLACAGCAAPVPQAPPGQAARLDASRVSLDQPGFRTDQQVRLDPDAVCEALQAFLPYTSDGCFGQTRDGNNATFQLDRRGFSSYWNGRLRELYSGISGSRREVLLDRYWAVALVDPAARGACVVAVDLGAPLAATLTVSSRGTQTLSHEQSQVLCADGERTLTTLLTELDPGGGSSIG